MSKQYNGHKSWALERFTWLFNEEHNVDASRHCYRAIALREVARQPSLSCRKHGAKYTFTTVRAALVGE
jgi:hypothetical protein